METGLSGKTVLITGAASGIGYATALAFAREGADLALIDRDEKKLAERADDLRKNGIRVIAAAADVSRDHGADSALNAILAELANGPDVLVNNVGFAAPKAFMDISDDEWEMSFQINFMAAVRVTRKLLPLMRKRPSALRPSSGALKSAPKSKRSFWMRDSMASIDGWLAAVWMRAMPMQALASSTVP